LSFSIVALVYQRVEKIWEKHMCTNRPIIIYQKMMSMSPSDDPNIWDALLSLWTVESATRKNGNSTHKHDKSPAWQTTMPAVSHLFVHTPITFQKLSISNPYKSVKWVTRLTHHPLAWCEASFGLQLRP
jgi:hypothetical protein